jgi:polyisoprenoid-binding protein YceI
MPESCTRWIVDPARSAVNFSVKHLMISKVHGRFKKFSGSLAITGAEPGSAQIEGEVEIASIDTRDETRDEYLKTSDFFDLGRFKKMVFRSKRFTPKSRDECEIVGDLALHGVEREVLLQGKGFGDLAALPATLKVSLHTRIHRKDFGLEWNAAIEAGGVMVGDEVSIDLELLLVQAATS